MYYTFHLYEMFRIGKPIEKEIDWWLLRLEVKGIGGVGGNGK